MLKDFISLLFPLQCAGCQGPLHKQSDVICFECSYNLPLTNFTLDNSNPVAKKFWGKVPIHSAIAYLYFHKEGLAQHLMHALKYQGDQDVGIYLGRLLAQQIKESPNVNIDYIVPVPLHRKKKSNRGYNQCDAIAKGIAEVLEAEVSFGNLVRITNNQSQTRKGLFQRWVNVETIFDIKSPHQFENKHILLIDDVITTGATLEACIHQLHKAENVKISVATLALTA